MLERLLLNFIFDSEAIGWKVFLRCPRIKFLDIFDSCRQCVGIPVNDSTICFLVWWNACNSMYEPIFCSKYVRTVILKLPTPCHFDVIFILSQMTSQYCHFRFSEILPTKFCFLKQFCYSKTTPPKINIRARPNYT